MEFQLEPGAGSLLLLVGRGVLCFHLFYYYCCSKASVPEIGEVLFLGIKCLDFSDGRIQNAICKLGFFIPYLHKNPEPIVFPRSRFCYVHIWAITAQKDIVRDSRLLLTGEIR